MVMASNYANNNDNHQSLGQQLLQLFPTYGWKPDTSDLSEDENFMDLVLLVTRSSQLKQGSMACIMVRPPTTKEEEERTESRSSGRNLIDRIISVATNRALFKENESDIHAEIVAIGQVARSNVFTPSSSNNATAYITMPPCKRCFAALLTAGISRIVSRYTPSDILTNIAHANDIEMVVIPENRDRINALVQLYREEIAEAASNYNDENYNDEK
jgi:deoxycytidylate deaminase